MLILFQESADLRASLTLAKKANEQLQPQVDALNEDNSELRSSINTLLQVSEPFDASQAKSLAYSLLGT